MNVRVFLFRLAIVLSAIAPAGVAISAFMVKNLEDFVGGLVIGAIWAAFIWLCYWIAGGLFVSKK